MSSFFASLRLGFGSPRVPMLLQEERAGVEIKVPEAAIKAVLEDEKKA